MKRGLHEYCVYGKTLWEVSVNQNRATTKLLLGKMQLNLHLSISSSCCYQHTHDVKSPTASTKFNILLPACYISFPSIPAKLPRQKSSDKLLIQRRIFLPSVNHTVTTGRLRCLNLKGINVHGRERTRKPCACVQHLTVFSYRSIVTIKKLLTASAPLLI